MSAILQSVTKSAGVLSVTDGTLAPDHFSSGVPYESDDTLAVDKTTAVSTTSQGLPFTANGRLAITETTPAYSGSGSAPFASGKLCMEAGTVTHISNGVPHTSDGSIASTSLA